MIGKNVEKKMGYDGREWRSINMKRILMILSLCLVLSSCGPDNAPAAGKPEAATRLDYSAHTDPKEARYKTILGDLTKLSKGERVFATQVPAADWSWRRFEGLIKDDSFDYDLRGFDLSGEDLSIVENQNELTFSTNTLWPVQLPQGFDPQRLLKENQNPGLGIRALHKSGVNGNGVGIAILDQALLLEHEQYKENLMYYEQIHCSNESAQMHGAAVASIAVGKTVGVAPGAKLYYIAETHGHFTDDDYDFDASIIADSILRVLEINGYLPAQEKIRVISISRGYSPQDKGYEELTSAIAQADKENILVITTSTEWYYGISLFGMDRDYENDPDDFSSYLPASWITDEFYADPSLFADRFLAPMGSRTVAACTGPEDYELSHNGGLSWAVPWWAGFYALCCEVKPEITPQEFLQLLAETSVTVDLSHDNKTYPLGKIVNPAAMMERLR